MELEQKLLQHYCTAGKRLLEEAAVEQREINQLVESLIETRRKLDLFARYICPYLLRADLSETAHSVSIVVNCSRKFPILI